jgi:hypothetical protein
VHPGAALRGILVHAWLEIAPYSVGMKIYERRVNTMGDLFDQASAIAATLGMEEDDLYKPVIRNFSAILRPLPWKIPLDPAMRN